MQRCKCTVGGRIEWIGTRSGTARRPGIPGTNTSVINLGVFRAVRVESMFS